MFRGGGGDVRSKVEIHVTVVATHSGWRERDSSTSRTNSLITPNTTEVAKAMIRH